MRKLFCLILFTLGISESGFCQNSLLSPSNNPADTSLIKSETSEMNWYVLQDSLKIQIGTVQTQIQKEKERIYIITTVNMKQSATKWIDSTIV